MKHFLYVFLIAVFSYSFFHIGRAHEIALKQDQEQHDLCYDTKTHEAYVARKGTELRCFQLQRQWPHRAKSSVLE